MSLLQALAYFFKEAGLNIARSAKVSLLAVVTIAVSLYVGGVFLLFSANLAGRLEAWRSEALVTVYLEPNAAPGEIEPLRRTASETAWTTAVETVSPEQAARRFGELFPSLADLVVAEGGAASAASARLPASLEISYDPAAAGTADFERWLETLSAAPAASMVDDDRDWLRQLETVLGVARVVGWTLGGVLLAAAVLTSASVIRLTAYIHRDEIAIMRLVGATEFYIRGPFYTEGLLQGLLGAGAALAGLLSTYAFLTGGEPSLVTSVLASRFLTGPQIAALLAVGALAGLTGAVVSLRREMPPASAVDEAPVEA